MANRDEIIEEIEGLEVHCRAAVMTMTARAKWFSDWCNDLAKFPIEAIRDAFKDWRQSDNVKFPTPGQMLPMIKAKLRKPEDATAKAVKWEPLTSANYHEASIEDKMKHHRIMAERARFDAGPMYRSGTTWGSGVHLEPSEMSDRWRAYRRSADDHAHQANELRKKLVGEAEMARLEHDNRP